MIVTKAPNEPRPGTRRVFLAGSIEMGSAPPWQAQVEDALGAVSVVGVDVEVLNPRRDDWDSSWSQSADDPHFRQQVEWELDGLHSADVVLFYFAPGTKSPVTLLELGLVASTAPRKLVVCCPWGFWRKGNVDIVCARYGALQVRELDDAIGEVRRRLSATVSRPS